MTHARRWFLSLAAVGALAALAGCQARGPLEYGSADGDSEICAPAVGAPWLVGDSFTTPDQPITIDAVELVNPVGVELLSSWLTTDAGAIGAVDFPPTTDVDWEHAVAAIGATVPARTPQTFAVVVQSTGTERGHADAIAIVYTVDERQYRATGTLAITVRERCSDEP